MRKILDKKDEASQKKKNSLIIGISLILLMTFSTLGYAFFSSLGNQQFKGKTIEFNGLEFEQTNYGSWVFSIQGYNFEMAYNPLDTENISVITTKTIQDYSNLPLYFGINSEEDINSRGISEIALNLDSFILRSGIACLDEECSEIYPVKNCSDNLILFEETEFTSVRDESGCIYIYSSQDEVERASDAFLYTLLGIQ